MSFVVKAIDMVDKTVLVDWGWTVDNHPLPQAIVDNPNMDVTQMRALIEELRPEMPEYLGLTPALQELIEMRVGSESPVTSVNYEDYDVQTQDGLKEF